MSKIYRSGNYIIIEKDGKVYEYAISKTVYTFDNDKTISLIESNVGEDAQGKTKIFTTDINLGLWENDLAVVYTVPTLITFLRENTGFNTASGGSGAVYTCTAQLYSSVEFASLYVPNPNGSSFPNAFDLTWISTGVFQLVLNGNPNPQFVYAQQSITKDFNGDYYRVICTKDVNDDWFVEVYYSADGETEWTPIDSADEMNFGIVIQYFEDL